MSKAAPNEEEVSDVKILTERLSAALLEISAKEDLVQQHAKVAEEAVSGICCLVILYISNFSLMWQTSLLNEKAIASLQLLLTLLSFD